MSARQPGPYAVIARKWLALAERRRAHLMELRQSGRWRHYYTKEKLDGELREIEIVLDRWASIAGVDPQAAVSFG
jgi:hypothetical protein